MIKGQVLGVQDTINTFGQIPSLLRQMGMSAMTDSLQLLSTTLRDTFLVGPYPQEIMRRTGSFRATFARGHADNIWTVQAQGDTVSGTFGSKDKRARILNDGGTIRPLRSKFLAVRTEFTKTPRGVVREKYQQSLRNLSNTFVHMGPPRGGRQLRGTVFEKIGKRIIPIAWLVSYVVIVGRKFMQKTEKKATPGIQGIVQTRVEMVMTQLTETLRKIGGRV